MTAKRKLPGVRVWAWRWTATGDLSAVAEWSKERLIDRADCRPVASAVPCRLVPEAELANMQALVQDHERLIAALFERLCAAPHDEACPLYRWRAALGVSRPACECGGDRLGLWAVGIATRYENNLRAELRRIVEG